MYQKEAHAFFVPLLYQLLDVYGGGSMRFFFILMLWTLGEM